MKLLEKILVPTKFSNGCRDALQMAVHTAKVFNSKIILMHVFPDEISSKLIREMLKKQALQELENLKKMIVASGVDTDEPILVSGNAFDQIIKQSNHHNVNVIMIGTGEKNADELHPMGITAENIIRNSNKPVWIVKPNVQPPIKKILCTVDFSEPFLRTLKNAIHLARNFKAKLTMSTMIPPLKSPILGFGKMPDEERENHARKHQNKFERLIKDFDFHKVNWNMQIFMGKLHQELRRYIHQEKIDLLVIGSGGKNDLGTGLLGKVAERVIREVPCSIITFKAENAIIPLIQTKMDSIEKHMKLGRELLENGLPEEAMPSYKKCIDLDELYAPAWEGLAEAYVRLGKDEQAEKCRNEAKEIRQRFWEIHVEAEIRSQHHMFGKKRKYF